jgi:long-chain acyl-CoA synthetase
VSADTIPARFFQHGRVRPDHPGYFVRERTGWKPTTWKAYNAQARAAARALMALGLKPGGTVCILGFNCPEWAIFDLAAMAVGGVPAGIYTTCSPEEVQYILHHAEASVVLLEDEVQWEKVKARLDYLPKLKHVVMMRRAPAIHSEMVLSWGEFLAKAEAIDPKEVDRQVASLDEEQPATFIYTSGTTGPPKAVVLSHRNLAWTARALADAMEAVSEDTVLSYLPLSHVAEQMATLHVPVTVGAQVYFAEAFAKVADNLKEVQPTALFGVPRVWEKFHSAVEARLAQATGVRARLLAWAQDVGRRANAERNAGREPGGLLGLQYGVANRLVYSRIRPLLGLGNVRFCISGAAPISTEILEFFAGLDVVIREIYGQSEDAGPTSLNVVGRTRFGTVGPVIPGVEVVIAEDGEIMVRGPNVFLGYHRDEEATRETLKDGWLQSGDLGEIDEDGFLRVTGRKKDIIITAGGKNITPRNIEEALQGLELVANAVVIGDRRKFLSALLTLDEGAKKRFAEGRGLPVEDVHEHPDLIATLQDGVDEVNARFARVEHVRKFRVLPRDFSIEGGELTPTMKVKRQVVSEKYAVLIEGMYADRLG